MSSPEDDDGEEVDLFKEPDGFYQEEKKCTFETFQLESGHVFHLRLIGHSPLWGHHLWPASSVLASYLVSHAQRLTAERTVLELGAGAALPSLACALPLALGGGGARRVVATDYPDPELVDNIAFNIQRNLLPGDDEQARPAVAAGYVWGHPVAPLEAMLGDCGDSAGGFDTLLLSDALFNHSQHAALAQTVRRALKRDKAACALVFFTPHRPWLLDADMAFFDVLVGGDDGGERQVVAGEEAADAAPRQRGKLQVRKVVHELLDRPMFANDPGDETLRRTVFGYEVLWEDLQ